MIVDSVIIGGGPSGITAAIYLARFNRSVLVIDKSDGRSMYPQLNENYLGFPEGVHARDLRIRGTKQAKKFGASFLSEEVIDIVKRKELFHVTTKDSTYIGKTVIFATGVIDILPDIPEIKSFIGKSLFWCITCDGYKTKGKKVVLVGQDDEAVTTCLQFLNFTHDLTFVLNCSWNECSITKKKKTDLEKYRIKSYEGKLLAFKGKNGYVQKIVTDRGDEISAEYVFNQLGSEPVSDLAKSLGIKVDRKGFILSDEEQRTNIPHIYAAGDVTKLFAHQVVTAAHEGATAAQTANYDLYEPFQKE
jgi:thioredoxin reductase (NADPH)